MQDNAMECTDSKLTKQRVGWADVNRRKDIGCSFKTKLTMQRLAKQMGRR